MNAEQHRSTAYL